MNYSGIRQEDVRQTIEALTMLVTSGVGILSWCLPDVN